MFINACGIIESLTKPHSSHFGTEKCKTINIISLYSFDRHANICNVKFGVWIAIEIFIKVRFISVGSREFLLCTQRENFV